MKICEYEDNDNGLQLDGIITEIRVNSSPPTAAYTRQWNGSALVQAMACRLFGAKPLPEPMLVYCHLDSWEQISVKLESEFYQFHSRKCICKCCLPECRPFCLGGCELILDFCYPIAISVKYVEKQSVPYTKLFLFDIQYLTMILFK